MLILIPIKNKVFVIQHIFMFYDHQSNLSHCNIALRAKLFEQNPLFFYLYTEFN